VTRSIVPFVVALGLVGACLHPPAAEGIPPGAPLELTQPDEAAKAEEEEPLEPAGDEDFSDKPATKPADAAKPADPAKPADAKAPSAALPKWMHDASKKITTHARGKRRAWDRLAAMVDRFGPRLSGSKALEGAIDWAVATMKEDGLADARREKVMVPHWVRGKESLKVVAPIERELEVLGLGMTIGTKGTLRAPVVVLGNVDEIEKRGNDLAGKIVLVNQKMPAYDHGKDESGYGTAVRPRSEGASRAAKFGAKALLIRSVTAVSLDTPHTGALRYADGVAKIPAAAITHEGADLLTRLAARGPVELKLALGARHLKDAPSANAIAELRGREKPEEIVLVGGHIDSWDVGDGASDDGAGCLMAMEAALILKELGLQPRRTIRVVLFTNEENGLRGAKAYYDAHGKEVHVAAIEADAGAGAPQGFSIASEDATKVRSVTALAPLFKGLGASSIEKGWGGADISPLTEKGVLGIAVRPDGSRYFDLHHSPADTVEKIDPDHLQRNAAAMALLAYVLAERP
jgi:carboxypeptidase Q